MLFNEKEGKISMVKPKLNIDKKMLFCLAPGELRMFSFYYQQYGTHRVTLQCTEPTEFFAFLWARSAAGANHSEGFDLGGTLPIYSS